MTGASGNFGVEALKQTLEIEEVEFVRILLTNKKRNDKLAKRLVKRYGKRIQIVRGSVAEKDKCKKLVDGVDYVAHIAAVIPPASDASISDSEECNKLGTATLIDCVKECHPQPKYIHISTVALYGNRNEKHPFGRVGDPLLVAAYDAYAMHKLYGERYCLDADLDCFVVLRQSAMLHPDMLNDNISDGLMFHTPLNAPLEWVSARDSGYLIKRIFERDARGEIDGFWNNIYNIGAGKKGRCTGVDSFDMGFALIGGSAEKYLKPNWFATRNFHGMWFSDSNELEELFAFQRDSVEEYWQEIGKLHKIFALGKAVPAKLIESLLFKKLLAHPNSPQKWLSDNDEARVIASFGSTEKAKNLSSDWKDYKLVSNGDFGDFDEMRETSSAKLLDHGYDESKKLSELSIDELRAAAEFRGGKLISDEYDGDEYKKLKWACHDGHVFDASPFTVLRGGHWCPDCCQPSPWKFGIVANRSPFYAQVWYDSQSADEKYVYGYDANGKSAIIETREE